MILVGIYEIAQLAGVSPQAISNWLVRKQDFPKPMASLASGPVWDAQIIKTWLKPQTVSTTTIEQDQPMTKFITGHEYTLKEIHAIVGGDMMSYLAQREGRIVAGKFKKGDMNPNAPYQVLVGNLPRVKQKAELLAAQSGSIPVFLKEGTNRWRFHGDMVAVQYKTEQAAIEVTPGSEDRSEGVAGVLVLRDVNR